MSDENMSPAARELRDEVNRVAPRFLALFNEILGEGGDRKRTLVAMEFALGQALYQVGGNPLHEAHMHAIIMGWEQAHESSAARQ